jgi:cell division septum initiation protein DivIVA
MEETMDILHLVDRLETLVNEGRRLPLSKGIMVDEQKLWDTIDQMRISIPEEVKRAKRTNQERDRILAQAHEEAARIVELSREEGAKLVAENEIARGADARAASIIERARTDAESLRADADEYVLQVLLQLTQDLERALAEARNGIARVRQEQTRASNPAQENPPPVTPGQA